MIRSKDEFLRHFNFAAPSPTRFSNTAALAPSAVLIPVYETPQGLAVVFTTRSSHLRHHAGEICFPGGRRDAVDTSLVDTALREFEEELGVSQQHVEVIGQLPDMPVISRFMIRPYIGFLGRQPKWQPDPQEVADVFSVPLHELLVPDQHFAFKIERYDLQRIWFIPWQRRVIWGATAGIVRSLTEQLNPAGKHLYQPLN